MLMRRARAAPHLRLTQRSCSRQGTGEGRGWGRGPGLGSSAGKEGVDADRRARAALHHQSTHQGKQQGRGEGGGWGGGLGRGERGSGEGGGELGLGSRCQCTRCLSAGAMHVVFVGKFYLAAGHRQVLFGSRGQGGGVCQQGALSCPLILMTLF